MNRIAIAESVLGTRHEIVSCPEGLDPDDELVWLEDVRPPRYRWLQVHIIRLPSGTRLRLLEAFE